MVSMIVYQGKCTIRSSKTNTSRPRIMRPILGAYRAGSKWIETRCSASHFSLMWMIKRIGIQRSLLVLISSSKKATTRAIPKLLEIFRRMMIPHR